MEVVIKRPYIEVFERILKLFTSVSEHLHLRLTRSRLELIGSNSLTNELVIHVDKKLFSLGSVRCEEKSASGSLSSKDLYHCLFSYQIARLLRSGGGRGGSGGDAGGGAPGDDSVNRVNRDDRADRATTGAVSKLILKFNKGNDTLEVAVKFKKRKTHCSAVLKLRPFCNPLKSHVYKNESIIQVEPTLFLINLKDLANERNVFLKNTDDSLILSAIETSDFSLNKEKIKREHFFYNNKSISIPSSKTKYFFKNKKFEDHTLALPLTDLKLIVKFCSDLNLLCLFSTKNFKENVVISFGGVIPRILEKNRRSICSRREMRETRQIQQIPHLRQTHWGEATPRVGHTEGISNHSVYAKSPCPVRTPHAEGKEERAPQPCVFYLSDENDSSDEYDSDVDEIDQQALYPSPARGQADWGNADEQNYNDVITGRIHFTSYFNMSCNFNDYKLRGDDLVRGDDVVRECLAGPSPREGTGESLPVRRVDIQDSRVDIHDSGANLPDSRAETHDGGATPPPGLAQVDQRHLPMGERTPERREVSTGENAPGKMPTEHPEKTIHQTCNIKSEQERLNGSYKRGNPTEEDPHHESKSRKREPEERGAYPDLREEVGAFTKEATRRIEPPSEDLNYDEFIRGNKKQEDGFFQMELQMKQLERTLDMVDRMEQLNRGSEMGEKGGNPYVASPPNVVDQKMGKKKTDKAECPPSNVCEANKRGSNLRKTPKGGWLPSCEGDSAEANTRHPLDPPSEECNSLDSENFYSVGEEGDSPSTPSTQTKQDEECESYFDDVYAKYHWCDSLGRIKRRLCERGDQVRTGWYVAHQSCSQGRGAEKRLPPRASRSSHYRRLSKDTDGGAHSWRGEQQREGFREECMELRRKECVEGTYPYRLRQDERFRCRKDGAPRRRLPWMSQ
ncbi:conserved Plasmodium protein, unknown function [Plasmodium vivax]|uniref:Uncharacterized protein n=1 Tax=Plasmodium vivax TaxID=5855 RepID=A0A564ZRI0_PLAVI|nr:conserved Plasmodium protein, unknown function [Plasmodium vivax]